MSGDDARVIFVKAGVVVGDGRNLRQHDVAWLPSEGWWCITCGHARCRMIRLVKETITP